MQHEQKVPFSNTNGGHCLWPLNRIRKCKLSSCERHNCTKAKRTNKATDDCGLIREISNTSPDLSTLEGIIFEIWEVQCNWHLIQDIYELLGYKILLQ